MLRQIDDISSVFIVWHYLPYLMAVNVWDSESGIIDGRMVRVKEVANFAIILFHTTYYLHKRCEEPTPIVPAGERVL